jgi:hypothetical protein
MWRLWLLPLLCARVAGFRLPQPGGQPQTEALEDGTPPWMPSGGSRRLEGRRLDECDSELGGGGSCDEPKRTSCDDHVVCTSGCDKDCDTDCNAHCQDACLGVDSHTGLNLRCAPRRIRTPDAE